MATPSIAMAANTTRLMTRMTWVTSEEVLIPDAQGTGITGWIASSGSSPRCARSWRTHHSQTLRKEKAGRARPHCAHLATVQRNAFGLPDRLDVDGGAVRQHFGDTLHDFGRIVAGSDDGVATQFGGVLQHEIEGLGACLLAQIREQCDVPADQGLQSGANGSK